MTRTASVEAQFGLGAAQYATSDVHRAGESLALLVAMAEPKPHWHVLDIATGAGHTALAFAPSVARVVASDLTAEMLAETEKLAHERGLANVATVRAEATRQPFDAGSFDLVTCRLAAHHFRDLPAFVAEVARLLRPGGRLGLVDNVAPDATSLPQYSPVDIAEADRAYDSFERRRDPSHFRVESVARWHELLAEASFGVRGSEVLVKPMAFTPWAERMRVAADVAAELRRDLLAPGPLRAFLMPHERDGDLWFSLRELVLVAEVRRDR
ncbi:MAG: class I SAM-dependent methyltransferase [Hyphomicrobiaceae bacterium]|nr:class I SAM-dependent methyltransferase [Hyphomicrobiaceae bacterium]